MTHLEQTLKKGWGYDSFHPLQKDAIHGFLDGQDVMVILPTGGGKSLCYQFPALYQDGLVIVISPLIALMDDQVQSAQQAGIRAEALHSQLKDQHRKKVYAKLKNNDLDLLYLSPERLSIGDIITDDLNIQLIAIDEAHCISQWGHDFRPEYRQLGEIVQSFPEIPRMALTATATPEVQADIVKQLNLRTPKQLVGYVDRPNLTYRSIPRDKLQDQLFNLVLKHPNEGGIIYAQTRKNVESIADKLKAKGIKCDAYHAGLPANTRAEVQEKFINEDLDVVVATLAFGMGIDRSNVRYVIHANLPKSIEHYQQEAGRAGRDGLPASCYLLHHYSDIVTHRHLAQSSYPLSASRKQHLDHQLKSISRYAWAPICRHEILVTHFGQSWQQPENAENSDQGCGACDVCLGETKEMPKEEALVTAQKIISAVYRSGSKFGAGHVVDILKGKELAKIKQYGHHQLSVFALMKNYPEPAIRTWIDQLILQKLLEMDESTGYPILRTTTKGVDLCKNGGFLRLSEMDLTPSKSSSKRRAKADVDWEGVDQLLFKELRNLRKRLAEESGQPPYIIFSDESLRGMARSKPDNRSAFLSIKGVGEKKMVLYGTTFMECIREFKSI